jgi:hypothetical protein
MLAAGRSAERGRENTAITRSDAWRETGPHAVAPYRPSQALDRPHAASAPLGLFETPFHFFHGHVSHVRGNPPDVTDGVSNTAIALAVEWDVLDLLY